MFVFEISTPGTWLDYEDKEWSWKIQNQLRSLESQFFEANAALNLFIGTRSVRPSIADRSNWEGDSQRRSEIQQELGAGIRISGVWSAFLLCMWTVLRPRSATFWPLSIFEYAGYPYPGTEDRRHRRFRGSQHR
jgi:hypothetical protein